MARVPRLMEMAEEYGFKIITIADLIEYRRKHDRYLERRVEAQLESAYGAGFRTVIFRNALDGSEHIAIVHGEIGPDSTTIVRVHRSGANASEMPMPARIQKMSMVRAARKMMPVQ